MTKWMNFVTVVMPRNGGSSFSVDPSFSGTVGAGTRFTPTAGRFLVVVVNGSQTATTPTGWTLPAGGSSVNNGGTYVWYRTAAGTDAFTTTANGTNYPEVFTFFEFAAGTTWLGSVAASGQLKTGGNGPTLGATATPRLVIAVANQDSNQTTGTADWSGWGQSAIELVDVYDIRQGTPTTDGYAAGLAYVEDSVASTIQIPVTLTSGDVNTVERLVFAVQAAAPPAPTSFPYRRIGKRR